MDSFTRHLIMVLAEYRRMWHMHNQVRAGEITRDEFLRFLEDHQAGDCDCDECRKDRGR